MKILIVDDEKLICEWLQFCIKEHPEYELVGVANNGKQALSLYKEFEPDLVLTDIKMPIMNGLKLLREIKKLNSSTFVILLTAFSEFEFVREAMRECADEYLLKTEINNEIFNEMLQRVASLIKERNGKLQDNMQYNGQKHSIIRNILLQEKSITEKDIDKLEVYNIHLENSGLFALVLYKNQLFRDFNFPKHEHVKHVVGIEYDELIYVIVGNLSKEQSELTKLKSLQEYANSIMNENKCMVGVSNISNSLMNVNKTVLEAVSSISLGFYKEQIKIYQPQMSSELFKKEKEECNLQLKRFYQDFYVKVGKDQYLVLEGILKYIEENKILMIKNIKTFCSECLDVIYLRYVNDDTDLSKQILAGTKKQIEETFCFSKLKEYVLGYAINHIWNQEFDEKQLSHSVYKAVNFIRQHYNEALSLEQIASEVNLNPDYFSRVFKEETGTTYSTFLANIRLKKAENLLVNTTDKVQTIAEAVGYANVSYFSTVFKKRYGLNPFEFRRNNDKKYNLFL